jgi:hypothetical protein
MSSSSSNQSGHAPALASSSRSPLSASGEDELSDDGLEIPEEELLADDPLHENGAFNGRFVEQFAVYVPNI